MVSCHLIKSSGLLIMRRIVLATSTHLYHLKPNTYCPQTRAFLREAAATWSHSPACGTFSQWKDITHMLVDIFDSSVIFVIALWMRAIFLLRYYRDAINYMFFCYQWFFLFLLLSDEWMLQSMIEVAYHHSPGPCRLYHDSVIHLSITYHCFSAWQRELTRYCSFFTFPQLLYLSVSYLERFYNC